MKRICLMFILCCGIIVGNAQTTTFNYTGSVQNYTVPAGISSIGVDLSGAQGGNFTSPVASGGLGGRVQATIAVTPGQVLYVYVGQQASASSCSAGSVGGSNSGGGGQGGNANPGGCGGSGGGGSTDIRTVSGSTTAALNSRLVVGGGGGGGAWSCGGENGGAGGGLTGGNGVNCGSYSLASCGGPGTQAGGGPGASPATAGGQGYGGNGGTNYSSGGGGGYYGGGGSQNGSACGGSSYIGGTGVTAATTTTGYRTGNGVVYITPLCSNPPASTGTLGLCVGATSTLANTVSGGTWASSNTSVATVVVGTGAVTGAGVGTSNITYNVGGGCYSTVTVTVSAAPSVSSISTNSPLCAGNTLTLTANTPVNITGYSWTGPGAITGASTASASVASITTGGSGTYSLAVSNGTGVGCEVTYTTSVSILASPSAIGGTASVCEGSTTLLTNSVSGGTWTSTTPSVATISTSGLVTGVSAGTSTISYQLSSGCVATRVVTVNALPSLSISPGTSTTVCLNSSASFTAIASGATFDWYGVSGASGLSCTSCASPSITPAVTGNNIYSVTATSGAGCMSTSGVTVSVNPLPADITGSSNVCVGTSTTLMDITPGGTWSSSSGNTSVGMTSGLVNGVSVGASTISYILGTGCYKTFAMTILPTPAAIGGTASVCSGMATNLTHSVGGGVWSSSNATIASVNPSGTVTGGTAGNATISYTLPSGCIVTVTATTNALPAVISGASAVCEGSTTTLTDADAGGAWTSSTGNATVNSFSGVVTGVTAGNATITYTMPNSCYRTQSMLVNAIPALITGTPSVCHNSVTVLSDATPGGTWSSSNPANAFVDASGVVTGIGPNTTVIIDYALSTGCKRSVTFTVNPLPAVIGGTQSVCQGDVTTLTNTDGGGTWATSNGMVATVNASGDVSGVAAGNATITYTLGTGCRRTAQVTVNALPVPISGTAVACVDQTVTLYNFSGGGTWISGNPGIATVNGSGDVTGVSAGQVNITYQLSTGCVRTQIFTVNALPATISGSGAVCVGQGTSLSNTTSGGTWSSSTPGSATIDGSGMVTGVSAGNTVITYALPTGCSTTKILTVNGLPVNITGPSVVCEGSAITLNNGTPGGGWTSESDAIATVSGSGSVNGIMQGTVMITYTLPTTCYRTKQVTVNPLPDMIGGNPQVCVAQTTTLDNATSGGTWSSSSPGIAPVNTLGVVNGLAAGGANITYTLPTGCRRSVAVVVNPLPNAITGSLSVCQNSTTTLNSSSAGGTWESGNVTNATITSGGVVMGMNPGTSQITYTLPTGCRRTANMNVNPLPGNITGNLNVCQDMTSALGNSSTGGAWTSSSPGTASVSSLGVVTGVSTGTANITYTLPTSCRTASTVVVNPLPAAIGGTLTVCESSTTQLTDATVNGMWSSSAPSIADVDGTGIVSGMMAGTATISYTLPTGCYKTASVLVNPRPAAITGEAAICQSSSMTLSSATSGGTWSSSNPSILMVSGAGVATGVAPGVAAVSYTLATGCARTLTISVDGIPLPISGPNTVCVGGTAMQSTMSSGGFWSSASSVASVSFLGEVSGNTAGTAVITYLYGSGCYRTKTITVNALPAMISGDNAVCMGSQTTLSNTTSGGTWLSNSTAHATVNNTTGVVTGVSGGMVLMSYVLPTGCQRVKTMSVNATPASIGGLLEICNGGTTTLSSTTPGGVWISGNTATAIVGISGGNVSALSAGVSTISYTLSTGCKTTAEVTVHANPAAITGMASVCVGSNSVLGSTTLGGIWSSANDATATVSGTGILGGVAAGNTTVTYSLGTGCYTTASVAVNALPVAANVTGSGSYCAGGSGISVGLDASQASTTYKLYRSGNSTPVGSYSGTGTPLFFGSMTTAGMYTVTATNVMGCSSNMIGSASVSITPVVTPMVSVSTGAAGDTVCAGTSVTFDATAVNEGTTPGYVWKVNGTPMSTSGSSYVYTPVNGDIISVTLNSSATCALPATATAVKPMTVLSVETPSANIGVSPSASVCEGTTVTFTAASSNGGDSPVYTWKKNGSIPMGAGTTISFKPSDNDMIMCILHSSYRCASVNNVSSNSIVMNVDKVYIPEVQISVMPGTTVYANQQVTFSTTVTNAGPAPTYQWLKNGVAISGAIQPTYVGMGFKHGDSVTCKVKGSGACGEETINSVMLSVLPSTGVATTTVGTTEVKLVPNPNNGTFSVIGTVGAMNEEVKLQVTDVLGQVVYSNTVKAANGKLNTSISLGNTLANGMYLLNVISGADRTAIHFVVKQ